MGLVRAWWRRHVVASALVAIAGIYVAFGMALVCIRWAYG